LTDRCASDCSENPFACSLQKIATESAPGAKKKMQQILKSYYAFVFTVISNKT